MNRIHLIEETLQRKLGVLSKDGALIVNTGRHTGRSAKQRVIVNSGGVKDQVDWGKINVPVSEQAAEKFFGALMRRVGSEKHYSCQGCVGPYPIEVNSLSPWHTLFACNMFRKRPVEGVSPYVPSDKVRPIQVFHDPFGTVSSLNEKEVVESLEDKDTVIVLDPDRFRIGIVGTAYAGEIKKAAFTMCNFLLPEFGIFPMHASANCTVEGKNSSVLFGLSGTGKTTLSADPDRFLIGDDEIIWTETGISNLEGGCYAKLIDLSPKNEPDIYEATNRFGAILENVGYDPETREINFSDQSRTENTRGSYPVEHLTKVFDQNRQAEQPRSIVFLTADAFGAMPAVAKLDHWQAQYHFVSGYTAKVAGTEIGIREPQAAFSHCFGAPFMPRHASVYSKMLVHFAEKAGADFWILNTGWTGGGYGEGKRFPIQVSRQLLSLIQSGKLNEQSMVKHPVFGFDVPEKCPGVDSRFLSIPSGDQVGRLADQFTQNIKTVMGDLSSPIVTQGGPNL